MSSLFPKRESQAAFLEYYKSLKDDEEEAGVDLFGEESADEDYVDNGEESGEEEAGVEEAEVAEDGKDEEEAHKAYDAALRDAEKEQLEALARRFEDRATAEGRLYDEDEPSEMREAALAAAERAAEQEAKREAERAAAAAAAAAEREATARAKREALYALYDLHGEEDKPAASEVAKEQAPAEKKRTAEAAPAGSRSYRIKKKAKTA